jgi:UDP:flavonoid glycosyltransferase YjiC (YdhE family)
MESNFFEVVYQSVKKRGVRAVFLVGNKAQNVPAEAFENPDIFISGYEPFSALFPLCSVIVHQCGIGTTAQALSAGKPQILVPFAHDQPDNARRIKKLGIGVVISARSLTVHNLSSAIKNVTENSLIQNKAQAFSRVLSKDVFSRNIIQALDTFGEINDEATTKNIDVTV